MSEKISHQNNISVMHLLAAIMVLLGHQCALLGIPAPVMLGNPIQSIGVKTIFVISGYLITKSLFTTHGNTIQKSAVFFLKRLGRIFPELFVCLCVTAFIIAPFFTELSLKEYFANPGVINYVLANMRLFIVYALPGIFTTNPYPNAVNGSLWTIPVEIALYILIWMMVLIFSSDKTQRKMYMITTILVNAALFTKIIFYPHASFVFYGTDWMQALDLAPYFLIGGTAYLYDLGKYCNLQLASLLLFFSVGLNFSFPYVAEIICIFVLPYFVLSMMNIPDQFFAKIRWGGYRENMHTEYICGGL